MRASPRLEIHVLALFPCPFVFTGSSAISGQGILRNRLRCPALSLCIPFSLSRPATHWESLRTPTAPRAAPSSTYSAAPSRTHLAPHLSKTPRRWIYCRDCWWGRRGRARESSRPWELQTVLAHTGMDPFQSILVAAAISRGWKSPKPRAAHSLRKLCQPFKEARSFTLGVGGSGQRFLNSEERSFLEQESIFPIRFIAEMERDAGL